MFTKIGLKNFKCFESVEVAPRLITVLIGANGTGKSSIIQALVLGKQTLEQGPLILNGNWLQLGEFKEVVRRGGPPRIEFHYAGAVSTTQAASASYVDNVDFDYGVQWDSDGLNKSSHRLQVTGMLEDVRVRQSFSGEYERGLPGRTSGQLELRQNVVELQPSGTFAHIDKGTPSKGDPNGRRALSDYAEGARTSIHAAFRSVFFIPAGRGIDLPEYTLGTSPVTEFSNVRGSKEQAAALLTTLLIDHAAEERVSRWFEEAFGLRVRARNRPNLQVALELTPVSTSGGFDNAVNQGYGYGPLVFVLAQLALAPSGATVCIEEPEIHLHPRAQAEVTAVLARTAKKENKQLIIATHSEHILVKLLNLVAKGELSHDELAVYYFTKDEKTSIASAEELKVNPDGTLEEGLRGFFEQELQEMEEFLNASKKSK